MDTEVFTNCWDFSECGCGDDDWTRGEEVTNSFQHFPHFYTQQDICMFSVFFIVQEC